MRNKFWKRLALSIAIPGLVFTVSCAKKTVTSEASITEMPKTEIAQDTSAVDKAGTKEMQQRPVEMRPQQVEIAKKMEQVFPAELILFNYNSYILSPAAQDRLAQKAEWLRQNPDVSVVIEGHCDERGSAEYNLALGERRSEAAKAFLVERGLSASRLTSVSYGEERPFVIGHDENAWSMNRRAHFVIE